MIVEILGNRAVRCCYFLIAIVCACPVVAWAEGSDLLPRLPGDTHLVILADDVSQTCVEFSRTQIGGEVTGKAFDPLVKELRKRDQAGPLHLKPWFGIDWPELAETRCPGVLAIFPVKPNEPGAVLLFEADASQRTEIAASVAKYFGGKGWKSRIKKEATATLTIFESAKPPDARVYIEGDAVIGIANSLAAADKLVKVKADASLAKEKDVDAWLAAAADHAAGDARFFCRPLALWKAIHVPLEGKKGLRDSLNRADRLGLGGISSTTGSLSWNRKEPNAWKLQTDLRIREPYTGALHALAMLPGKPIEAPAWLDAKTVSVTTCRWDFKQGLKAIAATFDEMEDPGPNGVGLFDQILDGLIEDLEGPKVDLRTDFFYKLGPNMIAVRDELLIDGQPQQHRLFIAQCDDEAKVLATLTKFFKGDPDVVAAKVGKYQTWSAKPGMALFVKGEGGVKPSDVRAAAIGEGQVLFATEPELLKSSLNAIVKGAPPKVLIETDEWERYQAWRMKQAGPDTVLESWTRPSRALAASYGQATRPLEKKEEDSLSHQMWLFLLYGTTDRTADLPHKFAPKFDAWSASLSPLGLVMSKTKGGNSLTLGAPQSPAMP